MKVRIKVDPLGFMLALASRLCYLTCGMALGNILRAYMS